MKTFLVIPLLITANLMLVSSYFNSSIFDGAAIYGQILPPLPYTSLTLPGTKWCGFGNTAEDDDDLGYFEETDKCCQTHAKCDEIIEPLSSAHSLENPSLLPKLNCECEQKFLTCLKESDDISSMVVGQAYFAIIQQCFAKEYPVVECVSYQEGRFGKRCIMYKFDESKDKEYQFFDLPFFTAKESENQ